MFQGQSAAPILSTVSAKLETQRWWWFQISFCRLIFWQRQRQGERQRQRQGWQECTTLPGFFVTGPRLGAAHPPAWECIKWAPLHLTPA